MDPETFILLSLSETLSRVKPVNFLGNAVQLIAVEEAFFLLRHCYIVEIEPKNQDPNYPPKMLDIQSQRISGDICVL